jgi:hypothetical protein
MLLCACYFYIALPFITLAGWFILIFYDRVQEEKSIVPAIVIILLGIGFISGILSAMKLKWSNYRFKKINMLGILVTMLFVSIYQGLVIFTDKSSEKFLPYSAFFLNFNAIFLSALVFISKYSKSQDMLSILKKHFPQGGEVVDPERETEITKEIEEQRNDPNWKTSFNELVDIITISKISLTKFLEALGDGYIYRFAKKSKGF